VLGCGRDNVYPREAIHDVPKYFLTKYFLSGHGTNAHYVRVKPEIARLVTFAQINLMDELWPIRGYFDAIFCRNVLIYFDRDTQRRLLERFSRQLKPGCYLRGTPRVCSGSATFSSQWQTRYIESGTYEKRSEVALLL
jgi:chemotaxis protein methyltransferase CheR